MLPADSPFAPLPAPGPHPATAELRAYAAGTLAPAEEHRIEAHTLDCARCADLVEGFSLTDAATTDQSVAVLRTRLQARIEAAEPAPGPTRWVWPRIAAAAALLGAAAGGIWGWEQQGAGPSSATTRLETAPSAAPAPTVTPAEPAAAVPSAPVAKAHPAPATKAADYAAATTPTRRLKSRRPVRHPLQSPTNQQLKQPDKHALNDGQIANGYGATAAAAPSPPAAGAAPAMTSAAMADKALGADTAAGPKQMATALKMKTRALSPATPAADKAATARVMNTPMPAAPAINPAPVGGTPALREYLRRTAMEFEPENARPLTGTVRIRFTVGADGKVSNLKVARSLRPDYDTEALRIVCDGPAWQPGIADGRRAALSMEVAVPF